MSDAAKKVMDLAVRLAENHDLPDDALYTLITERNETRPEHCANGSTDASSISED